jgi:bifunctional NMN adenylyltransferase/nudix hydrolase
MTTGVIVGRFQVDELTEAHRMLINRVRDYCNKLVIILGEPLAPLTDKNPLSAKARELMLCQELGIVEVEILKDHPSDATWSQNLDKILNRYDNVTLYGGRDSFIPFYTGQFPTQVITLPDVRVSATERRKYLARSYSNAPAFRHGVIHAVENRYPIVYPTVDVAVLRKKAQSTDMLLARKPNSLQWRFVGGFVDKADDNYMAAAGRELHEEVKNINTHELEYIGSFKIDDPRYRGTKDSIMTTFFKTYMMSGDPQPADDIEELKWFSMDYFNPNILVDEHFDLYMALINSFIKK